MSGSALKSLEETMRKLEMAMASPKRTSSPRKSPKSSRKTSRRTASKRTPPKRSPPKRKPPTPGKKSLKLTAREKKEFLEGSGLGSVKSLNNSIKFMEKQIMEYRNTLMSVKDILNDDQDIDKCLKIINKVL